MTTDTRKWWLIGGLVALIWLGSTSIHAQQPPATNQFLPGPQTQDDRPPEPLKLSARVHVQKNASQGYLVVKVKLDPGYHVYSLTQPAQLPATKLKCRPSGQFRLTGKFQPDAPPKVVERDPVFGQRLEKHQKQVQFFAPIEVASGVAPETIHCEVEFDGMVCSGEACTPINDRLIRGKFAGFYRAPQRQAAMPGK